MNNLQINTSPEFSSVFSNYPEKVKTKLWNLRNLIIEVAEETQEITAIEETLKWGEPSFLVKKGSTIRIDWKEAKPDQYAMYFKCTSSLVTTFKMIFRDVFIYEGKRALVFQLDDSIPTLEKKNA